MTDLTKGSKPSPPNPLAVFFLPAMETIGLLVWWLYAFTHVVNFPGEDYTNHSNGNAIGFNIVLLIILALSWGAANLYYTWRKKQAKKA